MIAATIVGHDVVVEKVVLAVPHGNVAFYGKVMLGDTTVAFLPFIRHDDAVALGKESEAKSDSIVISQIRARNVPHDVKGIDEHDVRIKRRQFCGNRRRVFTVLNLVAGIGMGDVNEFHVHAVCRRTLEGDLIFRRFLLAAFRGTPFRFFGGVPRRVDVLYRSVPSGVGIMRCLDFYHDDFPFCPLQAIAEFIKKSLFDFGFNGINQRRLCFIFVL